MTYMCKNSIPESLNFWTETSENIDFCISSYVPSVKVDGYDGFQKLLKTKHFSNGFNNWIFRGQQNHQWTLESTLERIGSRSLELRNSHLERFKSECRRPLKEQPFLLDRNENEIWAIGQHYGLCTPLLDWSYSPYVSLFFAFENIGEQDFRVVYALNKTNLLNFFTMAKEKQDDYEEPLFFEPKIDVFGRLISQSGLFTIAPNCTTLEDKIIDELRRRGITRESELADYICKIYIKTSSSDRVNCLRELRKMNIHSGTLFPDLIGAAKHCNQMTKELFGVNC